MSDRRKGGYREEAVDDPAELSLINPTAEAALLGAMLTDNRVAANVGAILTRDDFAVPVNERIFTAIMRQVDKGRVANPVTLQPFFKSDADAGGGRYLIELSMSGGGLFGHMDFARQIAELGARRRVRRAYLEAAERLADPGDDDTLDIVDGVDASVQATTAATVVLKPISGAGLVGMVIEETSNIAAGGIPPGLKCRTVPELKGLLGTIEPGTVNILAGRPGMCKTSLAMSAAWGFAAEGFPTEYIAAEMTERQMGFRHASDIAHGLGYTLKHSALKAGRLSPAEMGMLREVERAAAALPINFTSTGRCDIRRVAAMIDRRARFYRDRGRKLGAVMIDYIQLFQAQVSGRDDMGRLRVTAVFRTLMDIARDHDVAVFALSSVGRSAEDRPGWIPDMRDLRESGDLEGDADSITFLVRPEYYLQKQRSSITDAKLPDWEIDMGKARGIIDLVNAKNRHASNNSVKVRFFGDHYAVRSGNHIEGDAVATPDLFHEEGFV